MRAIQKFEGVVTEVMEDSVWADLLDMTNPSNCVEVVEIGIDKFSEKDRCLLKSGRVFYWVIEKKVSLRGIVTIRSKLTVLKSPQWTQEQIDSIKAKARAMYKRMATNPLVIENSVIVSE